MAVALKKPNMFFPEISRGSIIFLPTLLIRDAFSVSGVYASFPSGLPVDI